MTASYATRLLLQCLNSAFLVHLLFSCAVLFATPLAIRCAERIRPVMGARVLLLLRLFPVGAAAYAALAIVLPSYLRLEPDADSERIGPWAICLAIAGCALWVRPLVRAAIALSRSSRFLHGLQSNSRASAFGSNSVWLSNETVPRVAVAGLLRTHVLVSEAAVEMFSPEQLDVVLEHERAHQESRDNLKRLLWLILPDALPFLTFSAALERAYKRIVEWEADDFAVAGDTRKSMALAGALVLFARNATRACGCTLATSLIDDNAELTRRVARLLRDPQPNPHRNFAPAALLAGATLALCLTAVRFADLPNVHRILEFLSH